MSSVFRNPSIGLALGLATGMALVALWLAVSPASGHEPEHVGITGVASPECREVDQGWSVEYTLSIDGKAQGAFAITSANVSPLTWSNGGADVDPGESITTGVNYAASVTEAQLIITHDNKVHEAQSFASPLIQRPDLCPEPEPEPTEEPEPTATATPEPTQEPEPTPTTVVTLRYCLGDAQVTEVNGVVTAITDPHEDCVDDEPVVVPPTQAPTQAPVQVVGVITPPNTGDGGLR